MCLFKEKCLATHFCSELDGLLFRLGCMFGDINRNECVQHHDVKLEKKWARGNAVGECSYSFTGHFPGFVQIVVALQNLIASYDCLLSRTWPPSSVFTEESLAALLKPDENSQARVA